MALRQAAVQIGDVEIQFETGEIARQASGSVVVRQGNAAVLATVVAAKKCRDDIDFFPLSVDFRELFGAAGKIPHAYGRREGRLSTREILTSRIIDRSIRPLFPDNFRNETQVIVTLLSKDESIDADVLGILGATMALHISDIPWAGPAAGIRIARDNDGFVVNPGFSVRSRSPLDIIVSGGPDGLMMIEGEAGEIPEQMLIDALAHAQDAMQPLFECMNEWQAEFGRPKRKPAPFALDESVIETVEKACLPEIQEALKVSGKHARKDALDRIKETTLAAMIDESADTAGLYSDAFNIVKAREVRRQITASKHRMDGRSLTDIRPISGRVDWVATPHGSALFTRGETQAFVTCTISTLKDSLKLESVYGDEETPFFLHYNFPPYSVGETRPMRGPGRREIGHGNLAWRALKPVIPSPEVFPYSIRIFSEITESNGSSSMATVCGGCLALMDAGVPISGPVAGIAMGLIQDKDRIYILSDILGEEDHLGDMDFKVAGTKKGITAIQMDNKIGKLSLATLESALKHAREGYTHILSEMEKICPENREKIKAGAPHIACLKIRPDKIRSVIGPGGKTIQEITAATQAEIEIDQDGSIRIYADSNKILESAAQRIRDITREARVGETYSATVVSIKPFGAFVELFPGTQGLVHVSQWDNDPRTKFSDLKEGDTLQVKAVGVDNRGRIQLERLRTTG